MGGGHHITRDDYDRELLIKCIRHIRDTYGVEVYLEPGEAIALNAGYLVTEVMDIVENGKFSSELNNLSVDTSYTYYLVAENDNNDVSEMQTVKFKTLKRTLTTDDFQIVGSTEFTYTHNGDIHEIEVRPVEGKEGSFGIGAVQYKEKELNYIIPALPTKINNYYEPFVGGGAVYFAIDSKQYYINQHTK